MDSRDGLGLPDLLLVLFVGLKLCGVIDWSWWWVTAPFWGQILLAGVVKTWREMR